MKGFELKSSLEEGVGILERSSNAGADEKNRTLEKNLDCSSVSGRGRWDWTEWNGVAVVHWGDRLGFDMRRAAKESTTRPRLEGRENRASRY